MQTAYELDPLSLDLGCTFGEKNIIVTKSQDAHNKRTLIIAVISLIVSAVLGIGNIGLQVWREHLDTKSSDSRFGKIETSLRFLTATVAPQLQKAIDDSLASAMADPGSAQDKVKVAQAAILQLRDASVSLPRDAISRTGLQLSSVSSANKTSPDVWKADADFITYRSQSLADWKAIDLPLCTDEPLGFRITQIQSSGSVVTVMHTPIKFSFCKIILDSPESTYLLGKGLTMADIVFEHCAIFYEGGPITIRPIVAVMTVEGSKNMVRGLEKIIGNVLFANCFFHISLPSVPPPAGQNLTQALLAQNPESIKFEVPADGI